MLYKLKESTPISCYKSPLKERAYFMENMMKTGAYNKSRELLVFIPCRLVLKLKCFIYSTKKVKEIVFEGL